MVGQGRTEAAGTVAGIFSEHLDNKLKFLTAATSTANSVGNHFHGGPKFQRSTAAQAPATHTLPTQNTGNIDSLSQAELETLLSDITCTPTTRGQVYMRLLEIFSSMGAIDQAMQLSRRLKEDDSLHLPQFHYMFGRLIESHFIPVTQPRYGMQVYTLDPQTNYLIPVSSRPGTTIMACHHTHMCLTRTPTTQLPMMHIHQHLKGLSMTLAWQPPTSKGTEKLQTLPQATVQQSSGRRWRTGLSRGSAG